MKLTSATITFDGREHCIIRGAERGDESICVESVQADHDVRFLHIAFEGHGLDELIEALEMLRSKRYYRCNVCGQHAEAVGPYREEDRLCKNCVTTG